MVVNDFHLVESRLATIDHTARAFLLSIWRRYRNPHWGHRERITGPQRSYVNGTER